MKFSHMASKFSIARRSALFKLMVYELPGDILATHESLSLLPSWGRLYIS